MTGKIASDQEPKEDKWKKIAIHNETEIKGFFGPFRFLSNFWPAKVSLDGKEYSSVENAYQAAKYKKEFRNFFRTCSPEEAVTFANENLQDRYPDEEWKEMRLEIMRKLLIQKYDKVFNPENYKKLIETGNKYLEETNYWEDIYWGVSKNDTKEYGIGENNLGKMLMEIRNTLIK